MFVQINPRVPLVWRGHDSAQAGIDPPRVLLEGIDERTARALSHLVRGTSTQRLSALLGSDGSARLRLALKPVLGAEPLPELERVAVIGRTNGAIAVANAVAPAFSEVVTAPRSVDLPHQQFDVAVVVSDFVVSPMDIQPWLGSDVPHLPIVFTESSAVVGPLVRPGESACVRCVELDRIDADSAWSAIAPQVWSRSADPSPALIAHAAAETLSVLSTGTGRSTRIDAVEFSRTTRRHSIHRECGCAAIPMTVE